MASAITHWEYIEPYELVGYPEERFNPCSWSYVHHKIYCGKRMYPGLFKIYLKGGSSIDLSPNLDIVGDAPSLEADIYAYRQSFKRFEEVK